MSASPQSAVRRFVDHETPLADLYVVERMRLADDRGYFSRLFCEDELGALWPRGSAVQINESWTTGRGVVRGLHYQAAPHEEMKFVTCLSGRIFDVAVDVRPWSPTYLRWHGEELSAENMRSMLVPPGFAHGFQTLSEACLLLYLIDTPYAPAFEGGVNPLDPTLGIEWPLPISLLSDRDRNLPTL